MFASVVLSDLLLFVSRFLHQKLITQGGGGLLGLVRTPAEPTTFFDVALTLFLLVALMVREHSCYLIDQPREEESSRRRNRLENVVACLITS